MAESWQVFGHQAVKDILEIQLESGRLSQAYLFRGPEAVGKKTLGLELATKILRTNSLNNHPDFSLLDAEGEITVELIHNFMHGLAFKPFAGVKKVAIVNNAQNLNSQSGSALLKTLEEPSSSTIIILVASGQVLPTIISRCQTFYFYHLPQREMDSYAAARGISPALVEFSFGRVGRLYNLISDPNLLMQNQQNVSDLKELMVNPVSRRLLKISHYADLEMPDLEQLLQTWMLWLRQTLAQKPQLFRSLRACAYALDSLRRNQNKKLILQALFLSI